MKYTSLEAYLKDVGLYAIVKDDKSSFITIPKGTEWYDSKKKDTVTLQKDLRIAVEPQEVNGVIVGFKPLSTFKANYDGKDYTLRITSRSERGLEKKASK